MSTADTIARLRRIASDVKEVHDDLLDLVPANQQGVLWRCRNDLLACAMEMAYGKPLQSAMEPAVEQDTMNFTGSAAGLSPIDARHAQRMAEEERGAAMDDRFE